MQIKKDMMICLAEMMMHIHFMMNNALFRKTEQRFFIHPLFSIYNKRNQNYNTHTNSPLTYQCESQMMPSGDLHDKIPLIATGCIPSPLQYSHIFLKHQSIVLPRPPFAKLTLYLPIYRTFFHLTLTMHGLSFYDGYQHLQIYRIFLIRYATI